MERADHAPDRVEEIERELRQRFPGEDLLTADEIGWYYRCSAATVQRRLRDIELRMDGAGPRRYRVRDVAFAIAHPCEPREAA